MSHEQTRAEHARERDAVRLSLGLAVSSADRHGTYPVRRMPGAGAPVAATAPYTHVYLFPQVVENPWPA